MRFTPQRRNTVRTDHHVVIGKVRFDISLVDDELNANGLITLRCLENEQHGFGDIDVSFTRNVGQHPALEFPECRTAGDTNHFGELATRVVQIKVLDHATATSGVRIDIKCHALPRTDGGFDASQRSADFAPIRPTGGLMMRYVCMYVRFSSNGECFLDRLQKPITFVTHVGCVETVVIGYGSSQFDHFVCIAVAARSIDQARRKAAGPLLHGSFDVTSHQTQLVRCRCFRFEPHRDGSDRVVTD